MFLIIKIENFNELVLLSFIYLLLFYSIRNHYNTLSKRLNMSEQNKTEFGPAEDISDVYAMNVRHHGPKLYVR